MTENFHPGITGVALPWAIGIHYFMIDSSAVMLACKCCGNIRLYSLDTLKEALEEVEMIIVGPRIKP